MSDATTDDTRPRGGPLAPARPASGGPIAPGTHPWRDWAPARRTLTGFFDHVTTHRADDLLLSTPHAGLTGKDLRGSVLSDVDLSGVDPEREAHADHGDPDGEGREEQQ